MSVAIGSGGGGVGATAAGPAGFAGCCGCTAWAFGFGFELHAVIRKTTTAATGHHARVVMLGAPPSRISGLALTRNCKPGALKRSPPAPPSGGPGSCPPTRHAAQTRRALRWLGRQALTVRRCDSTVDW